MSYHEGVLDWSLSFDKDPSVADSAANCTWGNLVIRVAGKTVWDFDWTLVEVLEWLNENWAYLSSTNITSFTDEELLKERMTDDDEDLFDFRYTHDLSFGINGALVAPVIIWGDGYSGRILTRETHVAAPWFEIAKPLEDLGDALAKQIEALTDPRSVAAKAGWEAAKSSNKV
jgi:hypothetical protein